MSRSASNSEQGVSASGTSRRARRCRPRGETSRTARTTWRRGRSHEPACRTRARARNSPRTMGARCPLAEAGERPAHALPEPRWGRIGRAALPFLHAARRGDEATARRAGRASGTSAASCGSRSPQPGAKLQRNRSARACRLPASTAMVVGRCGPPAREGPGSRPRPHRPSSRESRARSSR